MHRRDDATPTSSEAAQALTAALDGCRALVHGLGRFGGGAGAARFLAERGAQVVATDLRTADELPEALAELSCCDVELRLGEHRYADFEAAQLIVANPAVAPDNPYLQRAREHGARITTEVELALATIDRPRLAVTGTQGKSSTAGFLVALLERAGRDVCLGGNLGGSLLNSARAFEPGGAHDEATLVLELSSYQLEHLSTPPANARPFDGVIVTNVGADHLERHGSRAAYTAAKRRILELCDDASCILLPAELARESSWNATPGRRLSFDAEGRDAELHIEDGKFRHGSVVLGRVADLELPPFQRANALAALGLLSALGQAQGLAPEQLAGSLGALEPPPHRCQELAPLGPWRVFDNGVSTTPDSTTAVLAGLPELGIESGCVWLLGGDLKELPLDGLLKVARQRVGHALCFGASGPRLTERLRAAGVPATTFAALAGAVRSAPAALEALGPGSALVFSPACASFDAYPNFAQRAREFQSELDQLRAN